MQTVSEEKDIGVITLASLKPYVQTFWAKIGNFALGQMSRTLHF